MTALIVLSIGIAFLMVMGFIYPKRHRMAVEKCSQSEHKDGYNWYPCNQYSGHIAGALFYSLLWPITLPFAIGSMLDSTTRQVARAERKLKVEQLREERLKILNSNVKQLEKETEIA